MRDDPSIYSRQSGAMGKTGTRIRTHDNANKPKMQNMINHYRRHSIKKGQDQIDLALSSCSFKDEPLSDETDKLKLSSFYTGVNSHIAGRRPVCLMSRSLSRKIPLAGFEPTSTVPSDSSFDPLSYRGILSNKSKHLIYNQIIQMNNILSTQILLAAGFTANVGVGFATHPVRMGKIGRAHV